MVRRLSRRQPECDAQGVPLRPGKIVEPAEHGRAQLVHPGERQLHLCLDARDLRDAKTGRLTGAVVQQRSLPDPSLPPNDNDRAPAVTDIVHQPVEQLTLLGSSEYRGRTARGHRPSVNRAQTRVAPESTLAPLVRAPAALTSAANELDHAGNKAARTAFPLLVER